MLYTYCPEMGEKAPTVSKVREIEHLKVISKGEIEMQATIGHYGGWYVKTKQELKGRGIKQIDTSGEDFNRYKLTEIAFKKLESKHNIKMIINLD